MRRIFSGRSSHSVTRCVLLVKPEKGKRASFTLVWRESESRGCFAVFWDELGNQLDWMAKSVVASTCFGNNLTRKFACELDPTMIPLNDRPELRPLLRPFALLGSQQVFDPVSRTVVHMTPLPECLPDVLTMSTDRGTVACQGGLLDFLGEFIDL